MSLHTVKISPDKEQAVSKVVDLLRTYRTIMIVAIEKVTSSTMHQMRADLRGTAIIRMAKNAIMARAMNELSDEIPGIEGLLDYIKGPAAFLCTDGNAFKLATRLDRNKLPAPAKVGSIADTDVVIDSFNTGIPPGPAIAELQSLGLRTRIEQGTVKIMEKHTVCHAGERVSRTLSAVLSRLGILPFEVGLTVVAALEDGTVIGGEDLIIDEEAYLQDLQRAAQRAYVLAVSVPVPTKSTIPSTLSRALGRAVSLAVHSAYPTKRSLPTLFGRAVASANALAATLTAVDPAAAPAS